MKKPLKIMAVGDIMLGDSPMCYGFGVGSKIQTHGVGFPFEHVSELLNTSDITLGNLEVAVSSFDEKKNTFREIQYRGQPSSVSGLSASGFNILSLATNHIMQHGKAALEETLTLLDKCHIQSTGIEWPERGVENACIKEIHGIKVGILNYNLRPQQYFIDAPLWREPTQELMIDEVRGLAAKSELVIVCLHWGDEFVDHPSSKQVELGRALIDAGARVIIGHHPHILQGIESYNGGLIAYSLGNFVFDMWQARLRESGILEILYDSENNTTNYNFIPVYINDYCQPRPLDGEERMRALESFSKLCQKIHDDADEAEDYRLKVEKLTANYRKEVHRYYLVNLYRYKPRLFIGNVLNAIMRRAGYK